MRTKSICDECSWIEECKNGVIPNGADILCHVELSFDAGDDFDLDELVDDYPLPLYDPEDLFGDEEEEEK